MPTLIGTLLGNLPTPPLCKCAAVQVKDKGTDAISRASASLAYSVMLVVLASQANVKSHPSAERGV